VGVQDFYQMGFPEDFPAIQKVPMAGSLPNISNKQLAQKAFYGKLSQDTQPSPDFYGPVGGF
jgi:hypothetical protein